MRAWIRLAALALLSAVVGCSTAPEARSDCAVTSLQQVIENPLRYVGAWFCGEALVARPERVTRIMVSPDEVGSYGTVVLANHSRDFFRDVGAEPVPYYLEAKIDPQLPCFAHADCVPWAQPIHARIRRARRLR